MSPVVCFYADDVTGATDALLQYERWGLRGHLQFAAGDLARAAEGFDVLGVAGLARSLPVERIEAEVRPALEAFSRLAPRVVQYKICSTFDSSPTVGSIGRACEVATGVFGARAVAVAAAQPGLGRYTLFSHHFARAADGVVHRLDRHPTMSCHPVTPMHESSLVTLLAGQTARVPVRGIDILALRKAGGPRWQDEPSAAVFDGLEDGDLERVGELVWGQGDDAPALAFGAGGLSWGIARRAARARGRGSAEPASVAAVPAVLALSGSCAPQTREQIRRALDAGWEGIAFVPGADPGEIAERAVAALRRGRSVLAYSALGTPSPLAPEPVPALAATLLAALTATRVRRIVLAGGDTAGQVLAAVGADGAELAGLAGGLPVLRLSSRRRELDGVEIVLKGGQVGGTELLEQVRRP